MLAESKTVVHETASGIDEQGKNQGHKAEFGFEDTVVFASLHFSNLVGQPSTSECTEDVADKRGNIDEAIDGRTHVVGRGLVDGRIDGQTTEKEGEGGAKGDGAIENCGIREQGKGLEEKQEEILVLVDGVEGVEFLDKGLLGTDESI